MAVKPVKFISDVSTKKQIIKTDLSGNTLFAVSGTLADGTVSSSLPITASSLFIQTDAFVEGTLHAKRMHVTEVTTSVYYEDSLSASINALQDVSASNALSGNILTWDGLNWIASEGGIPALSNSLNSVAGALSNAQQSIDILFTTLSSSVQTYVDFFDVGGIKNIELQNYTLADLNYISVDVMVKDSSSTIWKNDLISVQISGNVDTDKIHVLLEAPVLSQTDSYRVIVQKSIS